MLDQVLEKMKTMQRANLYLVPHSLNLSRADFDSCDIVEEIRQRVDAAGIPREKLTIEITESIIGANFDFMKEQIARFREDRPFPGSGIQGLDGRFRQRLLFS